MDSNTIADRLREFGQEKYGNMTQFAGALGMSPQALSPYLNGRRNPGKRMLAKLEQLGANPGYISGEGGSGDSAPKAKPAAKAAAPKAEKTATAAPKRRGRKPKAKPAAKAAAPKAAKAAAPKVEKAAKAAAPKKGKPGRPKGSAKTAKAAAPKAAAKTAAPKAAAKTAAPKAAAPKAAAPKKGKPGRPKGSGKAKAAAPKAAPAKRRGRAPKAEKAVDTGVSRAEMQLLEYLRKIGLANVEAVVNLLEAIKTVSDEDYMKKFRRAKPRKIVK